MRPSTYIALIIAAALIPIAPPLRAAEEIEDNKEMWLRPYLWGMAFNADVGKGEIIANVDKSVSDILENLEMAGALNAELRKGRWGVVVDGLYLHVASDVPTPGPFFSLIETTVEAGILDVSVFCRVLDRERGWLDALVGGRYVYLAADLDLNPDFAAVDEMAAATLDRTVNAIRNRVGDDVRKQAGRLADELAGVTEDAGEAARDLVREKIAARTPTAAPGAVADRQQDMSDAIRDAIADAIRDRIEGAIEDIQGDADAIKDEIRKAAGAAVSDLKRTASTEVKKALDNAERKLAAAIEDEMTKAADAEVSGTRDWVDPYVGLRGRLNLTDRWFAGARADIGGFGVGSELTWQLFGGVGYACTESIELEAGWRYLAIDFEDDGMVFDATISGLVIGLGFKI